ncbi:ANK2 [Symbiodinium pilosum]|uniref:ANK2 protein n=1 Tax=Symbiodinium pilosum TaxID=2952 RepID=A0A812VIS4_SYMPI|nr:ANK2 [Symbiodinium pilosum]
MATSDKGNNTFIIVQMPAKDAWLLQLSDVELAKVLGCLDAESLLEATSLCSDVRAAVKPAEQWLWHQLLEEERLSEEQAADHSQEPESGALRKAEELLSLGSDLPPKLMFRLRRCAGIACGGGVM